MAYAEENVASDGYIHRSWVVDVAPAVVVVFVADLSLTGTQVV